MHFMYRLIYFIFIVKICKDFKQIVNQLIIIKLHR